MDVRFSITVRQRQTLRDLMEAIAEGDWTPIPLYLDFGDGAERGRPSYPGSRRPSSSGGLRARSGPGCLRMSSALAISPRAATSGRQRVLGVAVTSRSDPPDRIPLVDSGLIGQNRWTTTERRQPTIQPPVRSNLPPPFTGRSGGDMTTIKLTAMQVAMDHETTASGGSPVIGRTEMIYQKPLKTISGDPLRCPTRRSRINGNSMKLAWVAGVAIALLLTIACGARTAIFSDDNSSGTWSIVAVDVDPAEVGVALATCVAD